MSDKWFFVFFGLWTAGLIGFAYITLRAFCWRGHDWTRTYDESFRSCSRCGRRG